MLGARARPGHQRHSLPGNNWQCNTRNTRSRARAKKESERERERRALCSISYSAGTRGTDATCWEEEERKIRGYSSIYTRLDRRCCCCCSPARVRQCVPPLFAVVFFCGSSRWFLCARRTRACAGAFLFSSFLAGFVSPGICAQAAEGERDCVCVPRARRSCSRCGSDFLWAACGAEVYGLYREPLGLFIINGGDW